MQNLGWSSEETSPLSQPVFIHLSTSVGYRMIHVRQVRNKQGTLDKTEHRMIHPSQNEQDGTSEFSQKEMITKP